MNMKSAILGHNNDSSPRQRFIPKECKDLYRICQPLWCIINPYLDDEDDDINIRYMDLAFNGKSVILNEPRVTRDGRERNEPSFVRKSFAFYQFNKNDESSLIAKKGFSFWTEYTFWREYTSVFSHSYRFAIIAFICDNGVISLVDGILKDQNDSQNKSESFRKFNEIKNDLFTWENPTKDDSVKVFLKLTMDEKTLCKAIEGSIICEVHFFKCILSSDEQLSLEKMFSVDLTSLGYCLVEQIEFNMTGDKIFFSSSYDKCLILSMITKSVIAFDEDRLFCELFWSSDLTKGEILVNYDGWTSYGQWRDGKVTVFTVDYKAKTLRILTETTLSRLTGEPFTDHFKMFGKVTFNVSSGIVFTHDWFKSRPVFG